MTEKLYEVEVPGEYMVVQTAEKPWECFTGFELGQPMFSTCMGEGMIFAYKEMAEHVADQLGEGWYVIDVSQKEIQKAERLLAAIFREDEEDDEEWADGVGQTFNPD